MGLMPSLQSTYRINHVPEAIRLRLTNNILETLNKGNFAALIDSSAVLDTVDRRQEFLYGSRCSVLKWFTSYLCVVAFNFFRGSVLDSILILLYTVDLIGWIDWLSPHLYADNAGIPVSSLHLKINLTVLTPQLARRLCWGHRFMDELEQTVTDAATSEMLWCSFQASPTHSSTVYKSNVSAASSVFNHGVCIDIDLTISTHVSKRSTSCLTILRQLYRVQRSVSHESLTSSIVLLVLTRLDYCNAVLVGLQNCQIGCFQTVINTAARHRDHITPLLEELHWLPVREQIYSRLGVLS